MVTILPGGGAQRRGTWTAAPTMKVGTTLGAALAVPKPSMVEARAVSLAVIVLQLLVRDATKLASKRSASTPSKLILTESLTVAAKAFNFVKPANTSGWCLSGKHC